MDRARPIVGGPTLADEESRLIRNTLDATYDGVFIFDADTLRFTYVNQGAVNQMGFRHDELLGMTPADINPEFDENAIRELLEPIVAGEVSARMVRTVHRRSDGVELPVEVLVQYPPARPDGRRPMIAIARDISERVEAERQLRQSEERMRTLYRIAATSRLGSAEQYLEMLRAGCSMLDADAGVIGRVEGERYLVEHCWAPTLPLTAGETMPLTQICCALVVESGDLVAIGDARRSRHDGHAGVERFGVGAYLGVPVQVDGEPYGTLGFFRREPLAAGWSTADEDFVRLLGNWVGRTLERSQTADALSQARQTLAVSEDRERIARDLHDTVIQRLFAAGMALQGTAARLEDRDARQRLEKAVDDLDETIREIRSAIFGLQAPPDGGPGLRGDLVRVVNEMRGPLGFSPRMRFEGAVEGIDPSIADHLVPVLREALANVVRHAHATSVRVTVDVSPEGAVALRVADDGAGVPDDVVGGHGLANLASRAEGLGGTCTARPGPAGGSVVEWTVPAPSA